MMNVYNQKSNIERFVNEQHRDYEFRILRELETGLRALKNNFESHISSTGSSKLKSGIKVKTPKIMKKVSRNKD